MRDLLIFFNNIRDLHNVEDMEILVVKRNPFGYKIVKPNVKAKTKLTVAQAIAIKHCQTEPGTRKERGRDLLMLNFYLCGITDELSKCIYA